MSRRIMGLDPGSHKTGVGVIDVVGPGLECVAFDTLLIKGESFPDRIGCVFRMVAAFIEAHGPDEFAIEDVFVSKNPSSALKLGQARGAAICAAVAHNLPVSEYAPRLIKKTTAGHGNADKAQIQIMIQKNLRLNTLPREDEADGLAIAVCHARHSPLHGAMSYGRSGGHMRSRRKVRWSKVLNKQR